MKLFKVVFLSVFLLSISCSEKDDTIQDSDVLTDVKDESDLGKVGVDVGKDLTEKDLGEEDIGKELPLTELQKYIQKDDGQFKYELTKQETKNGFQKYLFYVTSQKWRSEEEVDFPIWTHDVFLIVPPNFSTGTAVVFIDGGSNNRDVRPTDINDEFLFQTVARATESAVLVVRQNPNQGLNFPDRVNTLLEDELVAYTWRKLVEEKDPTWGAYFPMAKGVIKSMDAAQDYASKNIDDVTLDKFIVAGFSKRGATTYMVAAADERVIGFAPGVFDVLGFNDQMKHHFGSYGFWAPAMQSYVDENFVAILNTDDMTYLETYMDPLSYIDYLDEPKFLIMGAGDQFFLPDAAHSYLDKLKGDTTMRVYANAGHSLAQRQEDMVRDLTFWIQDLLAGEKAPTLSWERNGNQLKISADETPTAAYIWTVTNENARDFRIDEVGIWERVELEFQAEGVYELTLEEPEKGFTGHIIDLQFGTRTYSTPAFVSPDVLPFAADN